MQQDWNTLAQQFQRALASIKSDSELLDRVHAANYWFLPALVCKAIDAVLPWFSIDGALAKIAGRMKSSARKKVGVIMAGNVPLVGLHDLVSVLAAGHHAIVKLSGKDALLIPALLERIEAELPVQIVDRIDPRAIDFLLATGSDNTARYLEHDFGSVPRIIRKNRFSVAVLRGNETPDQLDRLAGDILLYHGMGCRSVSNLLVPENMDLKPLWTALDGYPRDLLAAEWDQLLRWEQAVKRMDDHTELPCRTVIPENREQLAAAKVGVLHLVRYRSPEEAALHLAGVSEQIQCVVGEGVQPLGFGAAQQPAWDDFADGVNVVAALREAFS